MTLSGLDSRDQTMNENIFGSLATVARRVNYLHEQTAGVHHLNRLQPQAPGPQDIPLVTVTIAADRRFDRVVCELLAPETAEIPLEQSGTNWDLLSWTYVQSWHTVLPPQPDGTLVRYRIKAYPADGGEPVWADDGATFSYLVQDMPTPAWTREAVVYQVFPDRFYPGDGRSWNTTTHLSDIYGGTLRGIIDKLDYIAELGFNTIWLNPFFPDSTHHGYHATDHFSINPRLGTMDDMEALIDGAHARGIRLLLDFVGNHVGSDHPYFQDALADRESPYHDWFLWNEWPHDYVAYYHVPELPELATQHPEVRDYLFRSVCFWWEKGFDGLRIDYTVGPSLDYWTALQAAVRAVKPGAWLFGETTHAPPKQLQFQGRFHGNLDFLLAQKLRDTFAFNTLNVAALDAFLHNHDAFFPETISRPSFLDNHDMNRFLWIAGGDKRKLKLAALCQFTLRHPPVVYNGTEVGVSQERGMSAPDSQGMEECRQPMLWGDDQDADLLAYYRWLIQLRREHPLIWQGRRQTLHVDAAAGTYVYAISDERQSLLVALNVGDDARKLTLSIPGTSETHTFHLNPWAGDVHFARLSEG